MEQRHIGKNGPLVSAIGLGCMGMSMGYGKGKDAESIATLKRAIDLGVTLIDTADMYGWGHNEELIGNILKTHRNQITLATKMGFVKSDGNNDYKYSLDGSPAYIKKACDASLKRLGTEIIDLYYLHRVDPNTPIEDSIGAMADLIKAGKIRHIGISEVRPETIRRAAAIHPITAVQTEYSLWERNPEKEIIPACEELGIGFVAYSPLGRGFLSGTIDNVEALEAEDCRRILPRFQGEHFVKNKKLLDGFSQIAKQKQCSMTQLALAWLLTKNKNIISIPGTKQVKYLEENIGATQLRLNQEDMQNLDVLFPLDIASGNKYPEVFQCEA